MLIFRFINVYSVTTKKSLRALRPPKPSVFSYCPLLQHSIPPLSDTLCFSSCLIKALPLCTQSGLIGQLTHASAHAANNNRAVVLNQLLCAKLAPLWRFGDILGYQEIMEKKGGTMARRCGVVFSIGADADLF